MRSTANALYEFFSGFGIPAYLQDTIPDNAQMPYITYELFEPECLTTAFFNASVWYKDTGLDAISRKVDEIRDAIGNGGVTLHTEEGVIRLYRDERFAQMMSDPNPETKRAYLSMIIMNNQI